MESNLPHFKLILGSSSIARRQILTEMGYQFTLMSADIDEKSIRKERPEELVLALAEAKADAIVLKLQTNEFEDEEQPTVLIASDTDLFHAYISYIRTLYNQSSDTLMQVLNIIAEKCAVTSTVLLADFMNKPSATLPNSVFHFYSDWPDQLLPTLGFSHVKLSQIGDPDANFGLLRDPLNLFNKLLRLPRTAQIHPDDGTPCCRLYLVEASGLPSQDNNHVSL